MSSNSSNSSKGGGNTITPPFSSPKQISPSKRWCFTLNNYTKEECSSIVPVLLARTNLSVIGKEIGESGTPHLQGYFELKVKARPMSLGLPNRIHFEKCKGNRMSNIAYCSKEGDMLMDHDANRVIVNLIDPTYAWEREILEIIPCEPDDRTIYWYWGEGNKGKTSFCKYLTVKHGAIALGGKGADMRNGVVEYKKNNDGLLPQLVLINIPRSFSLEYISYEGIENVKDMYFYSGKYEGGMICGNSPHIFVFANEPPESSKLSEDRWVIKEVDAC